MIPQAAVAAGPPGRRAAVRFPGLRPFAEEDARCFFGREAETRELLSRLRRARFLAILGDSGCGKSSVARAGLVAALRDGFLVGEHPWRIATVRPGSGPMVELARALAGEGLATGASREAIAMLQAALRQGPAGLIRAVEASGMRGPLLVLVDQFEELFRFTREARGGDDEARAFVKLLLEAAAQRALPIHVALTMRTEFLGPCAVFPGLPAAINQGLFLVPEMTRLQLRDALVGPVEAAGARISEQLVNRILNELPEGADRLPILQHALLRLWTRWSATRRDDPIGLVEYESIGNLAHALARHLEEVHEGLDAGDRSVAERLFRAITTMSANGVAVRRGVKLGELETALGAPPEVLRRIIERFREEGRSFLMPPAAVALAPDETIDISHECLMRAWPRLKGWMEDEARTAAVARSVENAAKEWRSHEREVSYLFRGAQLAEARRGADRTRAPLSEDARAFLEASEVVDAQLDLQSEQRAARVLRANAEASRRAAEAHHATVFLAHGHLDASPAATIRDVLAAAGYEVLSAQTELRAGADWARAGEAALGRADVVVAVIGLAALSSEFVRQEVTAALRARKRVIPVSVQGARPGSIDPILGELQALSLEAPGFDALLLDAVGTDLAWVREHGRLLLQATEWRTTRGPLLCGAELAEAEELVARDDPRRRPRITDLQREFVRASRAADATLQRRQTARFAVTAAALAALALTTGAAWLRESRAHAIAEVHRAAAVTAEDEAKRARRDAEHERDLANQRLALLQQGWGKLQTTAVRASAGEADRALAANAELQRLVDGRAADAGSGRTTIRYFPAKLRQDADPKRVLAALRGLGFELQVDTERGAGVAPTNALWAGADVPLDDTKAVAYTLIRAGVELKKLDRPALPGRERVLQVGGSPSAMGLPPLTVEQIRSATTLPVPPSVPR